MKREDSVIKLKTTHFKPLINCLFILSLILLSSDAFGAIINVPTPAHPTIQAGINAANTGDTVLVANGTYTGPGNRNINFVGKAITVKSANGPETCIIDVKGDGRGVYFRNGEGENSVLSGFTITGGGLGSAFAGAGILIASNCSPTIDDCIIKGNSAGGAMGGGIYSLGAPKILNSIIEDNFAEQYSSGIVSIGPARISDCIIRNNATPTSGAGGIYASGGTTITNSSITNNYGDETGGIRITGAADIIDCTISGNEALYFVAGGIELKDATVNIIRSTISGNGAFAPTVGSGTGGIDMVNSSLNLINCMILYNDGGTGGWTSGLSASNNSRASVVNSTFSLNGIGGFYVRNPFVIRSLDQSDLIITNSIVWENISYTPGEGEKEAEIGGDFDPNRITFTNIKQDGFEGINGNIRQDPLFIDGDFHLSEDSPCKDAGTSEGAPIYDIDGDARPHDSGFDMGADEYVAEGQFVDVASGSNHEASIYAIFYAGITTGCSQNPLRFCPQDPVTRAQMAAFIIRALEGEPPSDYCDTGSPFPDVDSNLRVCKYIKRLYELDITKGYPDGTYRPYNNVTRAQMAAFIIRALEGEPPNNYCATGSPFPDVPSSSPTCKYIKRFFELGITTGYSDGTYRPSNNVIRRQMAAFLDRAFLQMDGV